MSFTVDATKGWAFPATAAEWNSFIALSGSPLASWSAPGFLWNCQEAGGNLADVIGGRTLTAAGAPGYNTTIAGFARKAVTFTDGTVHQDFNASTGSPNPNANSVAWLACLDITTVASGPRTLMAMDISGGKLSAQVLATGKIRLYLNGVTATSTSNYIGIGAFWIAVIYNHTGTVAMLVTSLGEVLTPTWFVLTADGGKGIGDLDGAGAPGADFLYVAAWEGATAERSSADATALFASLQSPPAQAGTFSGTTISDAISIGTDATDPIDRTRGGFVIAAVADTAPPTITVVSPTPGVDPGAPGGFPADWLTARNTPIVVDVADLAPGLAYTALIATLPGGVEEVVYRRGSFRGNYAAYSTVTAIAHGSRFSVRRDEGWPPGAVTFDIDAVDAAGNLA